MNQDAKMLLKHAASAASLFVTHRLKASQSGRFINHLVKAIKAAMDELNYPS